MEENHRCSGKVLILEDEPIIGRVTARTLVAIGFEVDIAVNGLIAKEKIASNKYDLCIFDIRTPGMNGIQLYEWMEQAHSDLIDRVIFSTGDSLGVGTKAFLDRIGNPSLPKPYTPTQLRSVVRETLSNKAAHVCN